MEIHGYNFTTVEADIGDRTYRPRSAKEVVEIQHKRLHNFIEKNKRAQSAHKTSGFLRKRTEANRFYRPKTASDIQSTAKKQTGAKGSRPKTANERGQPNIPPANPPFLSIAAWQRPTSQINHSKEKRQFIENQQINKQLSGAIKAQLEPKRGFLSQGIYKRGKSAGGENGADEENQWLTFGGGDVDKRSSGVLDAFAGMRSERDYYSIEGEMGRRVAQQIRRGDKIRIGVNGRIVNESYNLNLTDLCLGDTAKSLDNLLQSARAQNNAETVGEDVENLTVDSPPSGRPLSAREKRQEKLKKPRLPLNWDQQVESSESLKNASSNLTLPSQCKPEVEFKRLLPESSLPKQLISQPIYYDKSPRSQPFKASSDRTNAPSSKTSQSAVRSSSVTDLGQNRDGGNFSQNLSEERAASCGLSDFRVSENIFDEDSLNGNVPSIDDIVAMVRARSESQFSSALSDYEQQQLNAIRRGMSSAQSDWGSPARASVPSYPRSSTRPSTSRRKRPEDQPPLAIGRSSTLHSREQKPVKSIQETNAAYLEAISSPDKNESFPQPAQPPPSPTGVRPS